MKPENIKEQELNEEQLDEATGGALYFSYFCQQKGI